jgi:hypothetical protein
VTSSSQREADPADAVLEVLRNMDAACSGGHGNAFGDLFTDDGRLLLLYREPVILLMNSHARRIEKVT